MTENNSFFNQSGGQPTGNGDPSTPSASTTEQSKVAEPITKAMLDAALEEHARKIQSSTDKALSSVNKKVADAQAEAKRMIDLMKSSGVEVSPTDETNITRKLVDEVYMAQSPGGSDPKDQGNSSPQSQNDIAAMVDQEIYKAMNDAGVTLLPEEMSPYNNLTPFEFVSKAKELIEEKRRGLANTRIPNQAPHGQAPTTQDAIRREYEEQRRLVSLGQHPHIQQGSQDQLAALYTAYKQKGMKGLP